MTDEDLDRWGSVLDATATWPLEASEPRTNWSVWCLGDNIDSDGPAPAGDERTWQQLCAIFDRLDRAEVAA